MKLYKRMASLIALCITVSPAAQVRGKDKITQERKTIQLGEMRQATTSDSIGVTTGSLLVINNTLRQTIELEMFSNSTTLPVNTVDILEVEANFENNSTGHVVEINLPEYVEVQGGYSDTNDLIIGKYVKRVEVINNVDNSTTIRYEFIDSVAGLRIGINIPIKINAECVITGDQLIIHSVLSNNLGNINKDLTLTAENTQKYILDSVSGNITEVVLGSFGTTFTTKIVAEKKGKENLTKLTDARLIIPLPNEVEASLAPAYVGKYTLSITPNREAIITGFKKLKELQKLKVNLECLNQVLGKVYTRQDNIRFEYKLDGRTNVISYEVPGIELKIKKASRTKFTVKEWVDVKSGQTNTIVGAMNIVAGDDLWNFETKLDIPGDVKIRGFGIENAKFTLQDSLRFEYTTNKGNKGTKAVPKTKDKIDILFSPEDMGFDPDEYIVELYIKANRIRDEFKTKGQERLFFYGDVAEGIGEGAKTLTYDIKYNEGSASGVLREAQLTGEVRVRPNKEVETPVRLKVFEPTKVVYQPGEIVSIKSRLEVAYDVRVSYVYRYEVENPILHYVIPEEFEFITESIKVAGVSPDKLKVKTYNKNNKNMMTIQVKDTSIGGLDQRLQPLSGALDIDFDIKAIKTASKGDYDFNSPLMWVESESTGFFDQPGTSANYKIEDRYDLSLADKLIATNVDPNNPLDNLIGLKVIRGGVVALERSINSEIDGWKDYIAGNQDSICNFKKNTVGTYRVFLYNGQSEDMTNVKVKVQLPRKGVNNDFSVQLGKIEIGGEGEVTYYLSDGTVKLKDTMTEAALSQVDTLEIEIAKIPKDEEKIIDIPLWVEEANIDSKSKYAAITGEINYIQNGAKSYSLPESKLKLLGEVVESNTPPVIEAKDRTLLEGESFNPLEGVKVIDKEDDAVGLPITVRVVKDTVDTTTPGVYEVTYEATDSQGAIARKTIKVTVHRKMVGVNQAPIIEMHCTEFTVGEEIKPLEWITVTDDGDISKVQVTKVGSTIPFKMIDGREYFKTAGKFTITYHAIDEQGASVTKTFEITVQDKAVTPPNTDIIEMNKVPTIKMSKTTFIVGEEIKPLEWITVTDDGDISKVQVTKVGSTIPFKMIDGREYFKTAGKFTITYHAIDEKGASVTKTFEITVEDESDTPPDTDTDTTQSLDKDKEQQVGLGSLIHTKYINGYPNQTFGSEKEITRGEFIVMLTNIWLENTEVPKASSKFGDIPTTYFAYDAINYLSSLGIVTGYEDGSFKPNESITRAEASAILSRINGLKTTQISKNYIDVESSHWAYEVIQQATEAGYMVGYEDSLFKPNKAITRAEAVATLNRIYRVPCEKDDLQTHAVPCIDVDDNHWAYVDILKASITHEHEIDEDEHTNAK